MTPEEVLNELKCLRMHLAPFLSEKYKNVLLEAERLTGGLTSPGLPPPKKARREKLEHKQLVHRYYNKGNF